MATTAIQLAILALTVTMITAAKVGRYRRGDDYSMISCCGLEEPPQGYFPSIKNCINPSGVEVPAYCSEGGWLVIQKRQDGIVDFNRTWVEYENGFGSLNTGEFWYGLKNLHCLTSKGTWEMMIDLELTDGTSISLHYRTVRVGPAEDMYTLTIGEYQGTIDDPMAYHNGMKFTTKDVDNDNIAFVNCALHRGKSNGGWWYDNCWHIDPNIQLKDNTDALVIDNEWYGIRSVQMKARPVDCKF